MGTTPTGSTAYTHYLVCGSIVYPTLDVLTLMPMFTHALNSRTIILLQNSKISICLSKNNRFKAKISCDGQTHLTVNIGDEIHINTILLFYIQKIRIIFQCYVKS